MLSSTLGMVEGALGLTLTPALGLVVGIVNSEQAEKLSTQKQTQMQSNNFFNCISKTPVWGK
jgi:hypothetical protein